MGLMSDVRALASWAERDLQGTTSPGIRSPWMTGALAPIMLPDFEAIFGTDFDFSSRERAMTVPGVFKARGIILSLVADLPLRAYRYDQRLAFEEQPGFLYRSPGIIGPRKRMENTIDDLIFYPFSLWQVVRGAEDGGRRPILEAAHVPYNSWEIDPDTGTIMVSDVDGNLVPANDDEVILFVGPSEGLLRHGARSVAGAASLESTWVDRARTPAPLTELHLTDNTQLDDPEAIATRDAWAAARRARNGAVALTPSNVEVIDHGTADAALFIEGRNSSRLDMAAFFVLPGSALDATTSTASLTYSTQQGTRTEISDVTIPYWIRSIEDRLSQDDIVPRGQTVRFDTSYLATATPTQTPLED